MQTQAIKIALVVEGISSLSHTILEPLLTKENIACRVVLTHNGVEALDYLLGRGAYTGRDTDIMPCIILLDLFQPRLDGLELLREIRAHEQTMLLPVVAFSSANERQQASAAYSSGANSYIDIRPGFEPFAESLTQVARYWCVLNEPPPALRLI